MELSCITEITLIVSDSSKALGNVDAFVNIVAINSGSWTDSWKAGSYRREYL